MRAILLLVIVLPLCGVGLIKPKIGLLGYCWFSLMRPDILAWSAGKYPFSLAIAICTVLGSVSAITSAGRWLRNPFVLLFTGLMIPLVLSGVFAVVPELSSAPVEQFLRAAVMALLIVLLTDNLKDLRNVILVMALSLGIFGAKFGLVGILHGGVRYTVGIGGLMGENNMFALGLVMALPLIWYGGFMFPSRHWRAGMLVMSGLTIATIVQSFSRGAALALVAVFVLIPFRSRFRVGAFLGMLLMAVPAYLMVQSSYTTRMETMLAPEEEGSARSRIEQVHEALTIWGMRPLLGVGFGGLNYMRVSAQVLKKENPVVVHNTYLEMLADSGIFAFFFWIALLFGTIIWLGRSARKMKALGNGLHYYPWALQTSLIAFAIDSTFHPRASFDFVYMVLMTAAAWYELQRKALKQQDPAWVQKKVPVAAGQPARLLPAAAYPGAVAARRY